MTDLPMWAVAPGIPSRHFARAALRAAALIDERGSPRRDLSKSYLHHASGGVFTDNDLRAGEALLLDVGLATLEDGSLHLSRVLRDALSEATDAGVALVAMAAIERQLASADGDATLGTDDEAAALIDDPELREQLLSAKARKFDDARNRLIGEIGEEVVTELLRADLEALGRPDLARAVRRVSLISDAYGYDIGAPRLMGRKRFIEVKATTRKPSNSFVFHLSRNESDVAVRHSDDWILVACYVTSVEARTAEVHGWCSPFSILPHLPSDTSRGRWTSVELSLASGVFTPGLPGAS